jgi:hypothetical protein
MSIGSMSDRRADFAGGLTRTRYSVQEVSSAMGNASISVPFGCLKELGDVFDDSLLDTPRQDDRFELSRWSSGGTLP